MDTNTWLNIALVVLFILIGGVFAGTEFALVSLRDSQIDQLAQRGRRGAKVAAVAHDPNRFLAAVQIGVTVAGFLSAAYGAATVADDVAPVLESLGLAPRVASNTALILLTLVISYLSLVLGELVPKRIALQRPIEVALATGPPLDRFATAMRPVIWLLSRSTDALVRLLGADPTARTQAITRDELRDLIRAHEELPPDERLLLTGVLAAARQSVAEAMRPRTDVTFLAADLPVPSASAMVRDLPYSRYPVTGESFDDIVGFVHVRDLYAHPVASTQTVGDLARAVLHLPGTNQFLPSLALMRSTRAHLAIVVDEYGGTDGIITLEDLIEELVGDIRDEYDPAGESVRTGEVDAGLTIEAFAEESGVQLDDGPYETVAGFLLARLGHLSALGESVEVPGHRLTVSAVEDRRIRRVTLTPLSADGLDP